MSATQRALTIRGMRFAVLLLATSFLTGCIYSINPLYTEKDLVFMPELIGKWQDPKDKSTITFTKLGDHSYSAVSNDDGKEQRFEARLVKLGELVMLDIYPDNAHSKLEEESLLPLHSFVRIEVKPDVFKVTSWNYDYLNERLVHKTA